jgi:ABC-type dipeptide/oligopeptide/nickel transport system ATPase subunit
MPPLKISDSLAKQILELHGQGKDLVEIGRLLGLKKMQVSAILAHQKLSTASPVAPEPRTVPLDGSETSTHQEPLGLHPADGVEQEEETEHEKTEEEVEAGTGLYVGDDLEYGDALYWEPTDAQAVQNPHLMIMGESGSGKTYSAQCLVAELSQMGIPSILFDYGQSFELENLDRSFVHFTRPVDHLIGEEGLALNPLEIFQKDIHGPNAVATRLSDAFDAVYHIGDIQRKVLIDAILRAFEATGIRLPDRTTWTNTPPTLATLQGTLEQLATDKDYPNYKNAAGVAARLTTFFMLNSFRNDASPWSWEKLINDKAQKVHILQFRGLEGKTQRVVVELLLWHLSFYLKSHGQSHLRMYCILDEAHHLSFRDGGPVDSLLREARKFGLGIIFASQQPEDFSPAAFSNSASKLVFQTSDPSLKVSKFLAAKCSNYARPEQIAEVISVLKQGEAFFITKNKGHVVRIVDLKKRATLWNNN